MGIFAQFVVVPFLSSKLKFHDTTIGKHLDVLIYKVIVVLNIAFIFPDFYFCKIDFNGRNQRHLVEFF